MFLENENRRLHCKLDKLNKENTLLLIDKANSHSSRKTSSLNKFDDEKSIMFNFDLSNSNETDTISNEKW